MDMEDGLTGINLKMGSLLRKNHQIRKEMIKFSEFSSLVAFVTDNRV
jgi:hypothetical protein